MDENCVICFDICTNNVNECSNCDIIVCQPCIIQWYNEKQEKLCPICKENIDNNKQTLMSFKDKPLKKIVADTRVTIDAIHTNKINEFKDNKGKYAKTLNEISQLKEDYRKSPDESKLHKIHELELNNLKYVRSHSQAISQCQKLINQYKLEPIIAADTAGSAKYISKNLIKDEAAIASTLAAKIYNLEVLKHNIEDDKKNVTRFLFMGKKIEHPEYKKNEKFITSCIFKVKDKPAALYKCLGGFATNDVSLSKLESFSDQSSFEQYLFLCDIVGHIENPNVQKSLEELGFHTISLEILGVYSASKFRNL